MSWKLDQKNTADYLDLCRRAVEDEEVYKNFRNLDPMTMIVENSPEKSGQEYFDHINKYDPKLLELMPAFLTSDLIGLPARYTYGDYYASPTTIRYIKTVIDLFRNFGPLNGAVIAEIGAGYGGLCKIFHHVFKPSDYFIFDLPEAQALQNKFLSKFGVIPVNNEYPEHIDLLIAMYSWSELSDELQVEYLERVIMKAKNCYIMLNYDIEKSYQLLKDAFPNADIKDYNIFYDENNTEYAPYNRFIIIKQ